MGSGAAAFDSTDAICREKNQNSVFQKRRVFTRRTVQAFGRSDKSGEKRYSNRKPVEGKHKKEL